VSYWNAVDELRNSGYEIPVWIPEAGTNVDGTEYAPERWAATFRSHARLILSKLGEFLGYSPQPLLERLIEDAQKIHQQRPILRETLTTATQPRCEI